MWQPGWEGSLGESGYMYMYGWVPLLSTWNYLNIVNHLYPKYEIEKIFKRVSSYIWGFGSCQVVCANKVIYRGGVGSHSVSLTPGGAGAWAPKLSHMGSSCPHMTVTPVKTLDSRAGVSFLVDKIPCTLPYVVGVRIQCLWLHLERRAGSLCLDSALCTISLCWP